ncbi:tetratricopeptide repeat protein [Cryobacterium sp. N21]|uniref:tetratricopeptide repeat protein n=1 Tax=Cryobacterium sp. N21 TaxID=2048289 RepID=UPI0021011804|nr:tetratricopeptide repeat protein [Cryobacterium sp. N21]
MFEMGGVYDSLGLELEAIPLYRAALEAGLEGERATRVFIQLASTLRNVGESAEAVSMLEAAPMSAVDEPARQAFLALALCDEGRYGDALRTALLALVPTLESYQRSLRGVCGRTAQHRIGLLPKGDAPRLVEGSLRHSKSALWRRVVWPQIRRAGRPAYGYQRLARGHDRV